MNAHTPTKPQPTTSQTYNNPNLLFHNKIPQQNHAQFQLFHNTFPQPKNKSDSKSKFNSRNCFQKSKSHLPLRQPHLPYPNAFSCLNLYIIYKRTNSHVQTTVLKSPRKFHPNQSDSFKITQYTHINNIFEPTINTYYLHPEYF